MAKLPHPEEDYGMKHYKPKDHIHTTHNKAKSLSFFASIFSLFIYISIFYIFNLNPYTLFNNNIFWFFMSNTLILIIAADYGAFSSSKKKQDLYEEYVKHSQQARSYVSSSYVPKYDEQVDKQCITPKKKKNLGGELLHEKKEIITDQNSEIIPERVLEIVAYSEPKKISRSFSEKKPALPLQVDDSYKEFEGKAISARTYKRSKSDRPRRAKRVVIDERENTVRIRGSENKVEAKVEEEENEFSTMTNEDLNRRVEEFIQKFNRQIRLQAARNNVYQT